MENTFPHFRDLYNQTPLSLELLELVARSPQQFFPPMVGNICLSHLVFFCVCVVPNHAGSGAAFHDRAVAQNSRLGGLGPPKMKDLEPGVATPRATVFRLCSQFINSEGRGSTPQFGFNGLGELVYQRTYARYLGDDTDDKEQW